MTGGGDANDDPKEQAQTEGGGFADLFGADPGTRRIHPKSRAPAAPGPRRRRAVREDPAPAAGPADDGLDADAFRGDLAPSEMVDLRAGHVRPEQRIDLHGLDREQARHALRKAFGVATASGRRCVLVVHGRGLRSPTGEATLKHALPRWLRTPPLDARVRAFAPAPPRDGGEGATLVLLRERAPSKRGRRR